MTRRLLPLVVAFWLAAACSSGDETTTTRVTPPPISTAPTSPPDPRSDPISTLPEVPPGLEVVGSSVQGRPLIATTVGDHGVRVYVVGGIHGDERTGVDTSRALLEHLREQPPPGVVVRWMLDANPDGSAAVTRDNSNGVDLNRNWPTGHEPSPSHGEEPLSEPETRALLAEIDAFDPDVIVAMHAAREGPFANYDESGAHLAHAFASGASGHGRTWEVVSEVDWPTPGSLGTHFGRERGIPVITVEGNRWDDPATVLRELRDGFDGLLVALRTGTTVVAPVCDDHRIGSACTELTRRVSEMLAGGVSGGTSGFLLKEAGGVVHAARWADHPTYPASSVKVVHLLALARLRGEAPGLEDLPIPVHEGSCEASGTATPERLGTLVDRMMIDSDNLATNAIQSWIGLENLAATIEDAGMVRTRIEHGFGCGGPDNDPANVGTVADLVTLYDGVVTGRLLDGSARQWFLDALLDITPAVLDELGIPESPGVRVLAKAGWYDRNLSIAGIAETPSGTLVFGVFTDRPQALGQDFAIEQVAAALLRDWIVPAGS